MVLTTESAHTYWKLLRGRRLPTGVDRISSIKFSSEKDTHIAIIVKKYNSGTYRFSRPRRLVINRKRTVYIPTVRDRIVIQIVKDALRSKYKIKYSNREHIIRSLHRKLLQGSPSTTIYRLDIKNFFDSIPHNLLLHKLKADSLCSAEEYAAIKKIIFLKHKKGIPQGYSISNVLSEIYLQDFDQEIKRIHPKISNYYRYVDDILLVVNGTLRSWEQTEVESKLFNVFNQYGLDVNWDKFYYVVLGDTPRNSCFEYLGYRFCADNSYSLSIAQPKYESILRKIDNIFGDFRKNNNGTLLVERIKYLVYKKTTFKVDRYIKPNAKLIEKRRKIYFGIVENYKEVQPEHQDWRNLDKYIKLKTTMLKRDGLLTSAISRQLYSISFVRTRELNLIYKLHKFSKEMLIDKFLYLNTSIPKAELLRESRLVLLKRLVESLSLD